MVFTGLNQKTTIYLALMSGVSLKAAEATFAQLTFGQKVRLTTTMLKEQALAWLATPMGKATVAITGISLLITGISKFNQKIQESRQEMIQLGQQAADTNKQLYDLISQYSKLGKDGQIDLSDQETAKGIQEQIVELVGDQANNIDLVNGKYDEEIEKLQQIKALGVGDSYNDISRAAKSAEANLRDGYLSKGVGGSDNTIMGGAYQTATESAKIREVMIKNGFGDFGKEYYGGTYKFQLDTSTPEKMVESYYKAVELASVIARDYGEDIENSEGALYDFYNNLNKFIDNNKEDVKAYSAAIKNLHTMDANADLAEHLKTNDINSQDAFDSYIEGIKNSTEYSDAYKQVLIDVANDAFPQFSNSAKDAGENANKMMVSLSEMKTASDNLSALSSAFKQLSDDGYISIECMSKIQEATKLSGDEWEEYQTKLMRAKVGSTEFNQVMSELTNKILENEFGTIDLTNATEEEISAIEDKIEATLRENNVANASAVAQEFVAKKKAQVQVQNKIAKDGIDSVIDGLKDETNWCGLTSNAYAQLVAKEIIFNKNGLNISGKLEKLQSLYGMLGLVGYKWEYLNDAMNGDPTVRDYARIKAGIYKREGENRQYEWVYNDVVYSTEDEAFAAYMINQVTKDIAAVTTSLYRNPDKNTPDYEDPTDAIINRINLRSKELEQQEEQIENAIEIAELENDYKKQISLTNDKLDIQKQKVDALKTANDELHQMAEDLRNSTPDWNEEEWFDSQGNKTKAYIDFINGRIDAGASKEEIESIKDQFEKISKIKKAWVENDEERLELTKEILKTEDEIVELRFDNSQNWINQRNAYNDWALFGDSEIDAWERVVKWLKDEYPNDLDKIEEAEQSLFEARKNEFDKANDFGNTYLESRKTLLQSYYDVTNSIAEAQHEINKELETSKTMYEWLDEDTRKLLFNQEDYNTLSEELLDIQYAAQKLQRQYERDLNDSTLETIESITSQYQMQYETLMKSYEIAKADLEIAKKKQKLNNVLNERNVRMFINGQWQWVANTEDVINAKSELADAEYAKRVEEAGLTQQESINNLTRQQNELSIVIKQFENGVLDLVSATVIAKNAIESMPRFLSSMYSNVSSGIPSQQHFNISGGYSVGGYKVTNGSSSKSSSSGGLTLKVGTDGNAPSGARVGDIIETAGGNYKIVTADTEGAKYNDASRHWSIRIDEEHADGTRYTPGGMTLMGEDGFEAYINSNGHLIPINQPTIGNIASGGIVFNTDQMKGLRTLWDMSNLNIGGGHNLLYNTQPQQIDQRQDNRIIINGMTVDSGSSDGQALISALRRYVGNH